MTLSTDSTPTRDRKVAKEEIMGHVIVLVRQGETTVKSLHMAYGDDLSATEATWDASRPARFAV